MNKGKINKVLRSVELIIESHRAELCSRFYCPDIQITPNEGFVALAKQRHVEFLRGSHSYSTLLRDLGEKLSSYEEPIEYFYIIFSERITDEKLTTVIPLRIDDAIFLGNKLHF